jgi:5'-nucleotidase
MRMKPEKPQILLTNDDGIHSPGLWAAAEALSPLGFVTVVAPREQQSGSGRSMPASSDGIIHEHTVNVHGKQWRVYAVGGTPAQAVQHGVLELMEREPDLVVAGVNYGENVGSGVTISGTVGAALEGAATGAASLAVSLETDTKLHRTHSTDVDFQATSHFVTFFGRYLLSSRRVGDVDVLKVDIPCDATPQTPWKVTRISRAKYFIPVKPERSRLDEPGALGYRQSPRTETFEPGTDAYAVRVERVVAVTPLSLDITSRVDLSDFEEQLRESV